MIPCVPSSSIVFCNIDGACRRANLVIASVPAKTRQVKGVDKMVHGMGERARHQLILKHHRQRPRTHPTNL